MASSPTVQAWRLQRRIMVSCLCTKKLFKTANLRKRPFNGGYRLKLDDYVDAFAFCREPRLLVTL
jgi:hypothetical protein